jgi:hypothetical protein
MADPNLIKRTIHESRASDDSQFRPEDLEPLLGTLFKLFASYGDAREVAMLAFAQASVSRSF